MFDVIAITDRSLRKDNFLEQIQKIALAGPTALILREKDLAVAEYQELAEAAACICRKQGIPLIIHSYLPAARQVRADGIHMPLPVFLGTDAKELGDFKRIGISVHSVQEALRAEAHGATYLIAGHVFTTDCKKGLEPRGLSFLQEVCTAVTIPVYAIGGISADNVRPCLQAGASGVCFRSGLMEAENPSGFLAEIRNLENKL